MLDASAAVLALLRDGDARAILAEEAVVCPHLVDAEVVHALRSRVLRGDLPAEVASRALGVWRRLGIERVGAVGVLDRVWELRENLSGYDAIYVAVAEAVGCSVVTADGRLARATGPRCPITVVRR